MTKKIVIAAVWLLMGLVWMTGMSGMSVLSGRQDQKSVTAPGTVTFPPPTVKWNSDPAGYYTPGLYVRAGDGRLMLVDQKGQTETNIRCNQGKGFVGLDCVADVLDVPAIQIVREVEYGTIDWCNSCTPGGPCTAMACDPHAKHKVTITTCEDRTRILEHDEQLPPKYWCRKVQP